MTFSIRTTDVPDEASREAIVTPLVGLKEAMVSVRVSGATGVE